MRGRDRVKIAREVKVDILHRRDLGMAAAGRSALHAETRPEARLAQGGRHADAEAAERVGKADRGRRFAFARRRRADRGDEHQPAIGALGLGIEPLQVDFGFEGSILKKCAFGNAKPRRCGVDRLERNSTGDFDIGLHSQKPSACPCKTLGLAFREVRRPGQEPIKGGQARF